VLHYHLSPTSRLLEGGVVKTFRCLPQAIEMLDAFNALNLWD